MKLRVSSSRTWWMGALPALGIAAGLSVPSAYASPPQRPDGPPKPPPFAYTACADKQEGDDCTVHFRDRDIEGSCIADLQDQQLFCMPDDMPPPPNGEPAPGPPPSN